jgi:hypothetical protein
MVFQTIVSLRVLGPKFHVIFSPFHRQYRNSSFNSNIEWQKAFYSFQSFSNLFVNVILIY